MSNIFSKLSKAVDAFTDVLTENIDSTKKSSVYKYEEFVKFFRENRKETPEVEKCTISVSLVNEFDGVVFPEKKYLIRIVLLDKDSRPIPINGNKEEFLGNVTIASSIDTKLKDFMGEKTEKTVVWKGDK